MLKDLRPCELEAEQVELLPARTLMTVLLIPGHASGAHIALAASTSGGGDAAQCSDIPWWAPKPPRCK
jgi:hypothetical protein